jgi:hypothetical protein
MNRLTLKKIQRSHNREECVDRECSTDAREERELMGRLDRESNEILEVRTFNIKIKNTVQEKIMNIIGKRDILHQ